MTITDEVVAFETGTGALNARDFDRFADVLTDDVSFHAPGGSQTEGKAACIEFYRSVFATFPDARLEVRRLYVLDDIAVEEGRFTGTHTGVGHTGLPVAFDYVRVLRHRDGRHHSLRLVIDLLLMLEQLGLAQASDPAGS
jgi:uncharacterized protein (TIGR02246 family)